MVTGSAASRGHGSLECGGDLAADRRHGSGDRLPRHPPGRLRLDRRPGRLGPRAARARRPRRAPAQPSWPRRHRVGVPGLLGRQLARGLPGHAHARCSAGSSASPRWPGASWSATPSRTPSRAGLHWVLLGLRNAFLVVAPLPGLVYLAGQDWLSTPAEVLILVANLGLLLALGSASGRPGSSSPRQGPRQSPPRGPRRRGDRRRRSRPRRRPSHAAKTVGFSAAEAKRKARASRERESSRGGSTTARPGAPTPGRGSGSGSAKPPATTGAAAGATGSTSTSSPSEPTGDQPVTGAEVIEKVAAAGPRVRRHRSRTTPTPEPACPGGARPSAARRWGVDRTFCGGSVPPGDTDPPHNPRSHRSAR